jgi:hypothetical protein
MSDTDSTSDIKTWTVPTGINEVKMIASALTLLLDAYADYGAQFGENPPYEALKRTCIDRHKELIRYCARECGFSYNEKGKIECEFGLRPIPPSLNLNLYDLLVRIIVEMDYDDLDDANFWIILLDAEEGFRKSAECYWRLNLYTPEDFCCDQSVFRKKEYLGFINLSDTIEIGILAIPFFVEDINRTCYRFETIYRAINGTYIFHRSEEWPSHSDTTCFTMTPHQVTEWLVFHGMDVPSDLSMLNKALMTKDDSTKVQKTTPVMSIESNPTEPEDATAVSEITHPIGVISEKEELENFVSAYLAVNPNTAKASNIFRSWNADNPQKPLKSDRKIRHTKAWNHRDKTILRSVRTISMDKMSQDRFLAQTPSREDHRTADDDEIEYLTLDQERDGRREAIPPDKIAPTGSIRDRLNRSRSK